MLHPRVARALYLRSFGIQPDIIVLRSDHEIDDSIRAKIASFCDVDVDCVFTNEDCSSIYDVPRMLAEQDFDLRVCERLGLDPRERHMEDWYTFLSKQDHANNHADKIKVAVVGKYTQLPDAYLSVIEALHHSGIFFDRHVDVELVDGEALTWEAAQEVLGGASGIVVPGGFGWACAWACRWPCVSSRATWPASRTPTPRSSSASAPIR